MEGETKERQSEEGGGEKQTKIGKRTEIQRYRIIDM